MNRTMFFKISVLALLVIFFLPNCASIVSRSTYPIILRSHPENARVSITDKKGKEIFLGNTPANVRVKAGAGYFSKAEYQVRFSSPGYDDKIITVIFKLDGWYFGNLVIGGLLGMLVVDPITGAMWKIDNNFLNETLVKSTAIVTPEINILNIKDIPESWKLHMVKLE